MVVACLALAIALGGTSYAALNLPAHSVGAKQLKPKAVTRANIRDGAVTGAKVANDSLSGADIVESSLGTVPAAIHAASADHVASADRAGGADHALALDTVSYRTTIGAVPAAPDDTTVSTAVASAFCDPGQRATGGGVKLNDPGPTTVVDSFPEFDGKLWTAHITNADPAIPHGFTVYAVCVRAVAAG